MNEREITFIENSIPQRFWKATLENCNKQDAKMIKFAQEWSKKPFSVFLHGGYGSGKTHFAFAMLRENLRQSFSLWPRYFRSPDLDSRLLKAALGQSGDQFEVNEISKTELLFIDDLGRETRSERILRQYFEIFDYRYNNFLPTIVTSNFSIAELARLLDGSIASRMQEWQFLEFGGKDLRSGN